MPFRLKTVFLLLLSVFWAVPSALAAGQLTVERQDFCVTGGWQPTAWAFARVRNTGDGPLKVGAGLFTVSDAGGGVLASSDGLYAYAAYLQPGEYGYALLRAELHADDVPAGFSLALSGREDGSRVSIRLRAEGELIWEEDAAEKRCILASVTNPWDAPLWDIHAVFALLDESGAILMLERDMLYENRALGPGSTLLIRLDIPDPFVRAIRGKGLSPAGVDILAYADLPRAGAEALRPFAGSE